MKIVTCQRCGKETEAERTSKKFCDDCRKTVNKARNVEATKQWYKKQGVEYHKRWRNAHPEYREAANKRAIEYKKQDGRKKRYDANYYQRHKEQVRANVDAWKKANPEKARAARHASVIHYRSRLAKAEGKWTTKQFKELCEAVDYHCSYCHKKFDKLTADHIVPLFRGGSNDISNIIPACRSCNAAKGATTPLEFLSPFNIL